jgi:beta-N-acetylhexosaminidase
MLRDYFHFEGVIMTDDLTMKAITNKWGLAEAAVLALEAGNDLLLVCSAAEETSRVNRYIVEAIKSGRLSEKQLRESAARLDKCFAKQNLDEHQLLEARKSLKELLLQEKKVSLKASVRSISCLRGQLPEINSGNWMFLVPEHPRYPMNVVGHLRECLKKSKYSLKDRDLNLQFTELRYSIEPSDDEIKQLVSECVERNCIFLSYRALSHQGQLLLGARISENAREKLLVCCDMPYDLLGMPGFANALATFDPSEQAMRALAMILLGGEPIQGICPVNLEFQLAAGGYRQFP